VYACLATVQSLTLFDPRQNEGEPCPVGSAGREVIFTESYTKSIENDAFCVAENVGQTTTYKLENY
jgi:hypothetical protein